MHAIKFSILLVALATLTLTLALAAQPARAEVLRTVEVVSMSIRVGGEAYTLESFARPSDVPQSATVLIQARLKSTAITSVPVELLAELDPSTLRWQCEDTRTGETTTKYMQTRLRLPPTPFDVLISVQGSVRTVESPRGIFKPYPLRLLQVEVGGVSEASYQARAVHPKGIVLASQLQAIQVPTGLEKGITDYMVALKTKTADDLENGNIDRAETQLGVLVDLVRIGKAAAAAESAARVPVTLLAIAVPAFALIAIAGVVIYLGRKTKKKKGDRSHLTENSELGSLWKHS